MKKAIAYIRVSSVSQEANTSLENQRLAIMVYASNFGYEITEWFKDVDSGSEENRVGLIDMRKRISKKDCTAVLVYKVDRFTRSNLLGSTVRKEIEDNGCTLVSTCEAFDTATPLGRMMVNILQTFAEFEKDSINSRLKTGKERKVRTSGSWLGGTPPIGYKTNGSKNNPSNGILEIDEKEANCVRECFSLYNQGLSFGVIAKKMNEFGYKTRRGFNFDKTTIYRIIQRAEVYKQNKAVNSSYELECQAKQPRIL